MTQEPTQAREVIALIRPFARQMEGLCFEGRIMLLCALMTQEICMLPHGRRPDELDRIIDALPGIMHATEHGMREVLVQNARGDDA